MGSNLLAVSDLHVRHGVNRGVVEGLRPWGVGDWLLVVGDVGEVTTDIEWGLRTLKSQFDTVIWVPGNHELWTMDQDPVQLRGEARYRYLVELCREIGVVTPEDPYLVWPGEDGPVVVAPLFLLYDYSFRPAGCATKEAAMERAHAAGVVCTDEMLLQPDPYPSREDWCRARVEETERRLDNIDPAMPTVLVNHFPLVRDPLAILRHPEFVLWCGTTATADWHRKYRAQAVVYGHLHIPRTTIHDGVRFEEVSLGYPPEWQRRRNRDPSPLRRILPAEAHVSPRFHFSLSS